MKRVLLIVCAIVFLFSSCNKGGMALRKASSINITDARYIFKTSSTTKSISAEEEGFWKMTTKGTIEALTIVDENEEPVKVSIKGIWEIGKNYLGIYCESNYDGSIYLIADRRTGKLYTYPDNAAIPSEYNKGVDLRAIEANGTLYLPGNYNHRDNKDYRKSYFVEVDVKAQTSTRCTPDALDANYFVPGNDGLLAFGEHEGAYRSGIFIMSPDKSLKKMENVFCFADKDSNLYIIRRNNNEDAISIYRIFLQGDTIGESFICKYSCEPNSYFLYWYELQDRKCFPINEANGNTLIITKGGVLEFNGRELVAIDLDDSILNMFKNNEVIPQYKYLIPRDNVFIQQESENTFIMRHLDLQTYEITHKELELFSTSDYTLVEKPSVSHQNIIYSCIRHSDSHVVSFMMDFNGKRTEISDSESSFSVVNFIMLN